jgi:hypothetical protein
MKRLFEDPHLPAELREDLQRSRVAASDYDASAQLVSLRAALLDTARDPLRGQSPNAAGAGKEGWSWHAIPSAWKLALLVAVGAGTALLARPARRAVVRPPSAAGVVAPAAHARPPSAAGVVAPAALAPPPSAAGVVAPAAHAPPPPSAPAAAGPSVAASDPGSPPAAPQPVSGSRREISQLERIRALLKRDPAAAYRLARRSEQEFPHGLLREERQALSIVALAQSGALSEAGEKAEAFFARYPHSPLRELVESALRR